MHRNAISHARLMRESTDRIESALHGEDVKEHLVAHRIFESTGNFRSWELEHSGLMRVIADSGRFTAQAATLRQTALRLIHGKALFEFLKRREVRGSVRARVLGHFHPTKLFNYALMQEHGTYLRKAGSFMCASHLGNQVVHDPAFLNPLQHYEALYGEYFDLYCATLFPRDGVESASERSLLPLLKHQLNEWRWIILNPHSAVPRLRRESEIRRPLGDTQRLPALKLPK
ncbi:MAG TPA: hypothetical protein VGI93_05150 [Steroidobacteraceae bacterium]